MSSPRKFWFWPDHVIGKRESRRLREEHNALANSHAELEVALKATLASLNVAFSAEENPFGIGHNDAEDARSLAETALAKAEGKS